jgi:serine/threonine protein kinase
MEPRILRISFLGSGSFSSVYKVACGDGTPGVEWTLAIALSLVDPEIWSDEPGDVDQCKVWEGLLTETVSARLLASLRQAAFNEYFGSFVVRGYDFLRASAQTTPLLATLSNIVRRNVNDKSYLSRWSHFRGDENVLVTLMGLGSAGSLVEFDTERTSRDTRRAWLFQLASSMLVASRAYGFEHRDFKAGNIILHPAKKTGRQEFVIEIGRRDRQRQGLPEDCERVCFAFTRDPGDPASCLIPKLIDFGFSRYAVTSVDSRTAGRTVLTQHTTQRNLPVEQLTRSIRVNTSADPLSTYPAPEMLFDESDGSDRDIASDVFAFGMTALHLLFPSIQTAPWWRDTGGIDFQETCRLSLVELECDDGDRCERARDVIKLYARIIPSYVLLLSALDNSDPVTFLQKGPPSQTSQSIVYRVLSHWRVRLYFRRKVDEARQTVAKAFLETADPAAVELVRSCLTWTREERGVLSHVPQVPRYVASTPAFFRLLFFPYFDPLRETMDTRKRDTPSEAGSTYKLIYRDPLSRAEALRPTKHATRTFERIVHIERDALDELAPLYTGPVFESTFKERIRCVLSTLSPPPPMPSPIRKKIRLITEEEEDAMTASTSTEASTSDPMLLESTLYAPEEDWTGLV